MTELRESIDQRIPNLDSRLCTSCGDCLRVCPTQCLVSYTPVPGGPARPMLRRLADCISCSVCRDFCLPGAIQMVPRPW